MKKVAEAIFILLTFSMFIFLSAMDSEGSIIPFVGFAVSSIGMMVSYLLYVKVGESEW